MQLSFSILRFCAILISVLVLKKQEYGTKNRQMRKDTLMARWHKGLSFYNKKKKIEPSLIREVFGMFFSICIVVFLAGVITYFFGMSTNVVGVSMEPVLYNGQPIYIDRFSYNIFTPARGDVIVFLPHGNKNAHYYVKRVVARSGDKVLIEDGICYVNGEESEHVTSKIIDAGIAANEITLKSGEFFCLGEDPNNSEDSRSANIGLVKSDDIIGRAWFHLSAQGSGIGFVD